MFYDMDDCMLRIRSCFSAQRQAQSTVDRGRTHTALAFRVTGETHFYFDGRDVMAGAGSVTFIPAGVDYTRKSADEQLIVIYLDWLQNTAQKAQIEVVHPRDPGKFAELFEELRRTWVEQSSGYVPACTAMLCHIFALLSREAAQPPAADMQTIRAGVSYLHRNFQDPALKIGDAAALCHVSEVYFRKLYQRMYHTSPLKALRALRMRHACAMLETGDFSVQQIAEASGFSDVKYFRTAFRAYYGMTCGEYSRELARKNERADHHTSE